jgi:hypothetical protein
MKALLIATALDLGRPGPDYAFGHGRIEARVAADALQNDSPMALTVGQDDVEEFTFRVPAGLPKLRVALVWDDAVASPLSDPALVNDLDLVLLDPSQQPRHPWVLNPDAPSQNATTGPDHLNNVEHVEVVSPAAGIWKARVTGGNVPEGPAVAGLVGLDQRAPGGPGSLTVVDATETTLSLTWVSATAADRKGTLLARTEQGTLWFGPAQGLTYNPGQVVAPGVTIVYVADEDHSQDPFVDTGLESGATYRYLAYSFDDFHNYSPGSTADGTTEGSPASAEGTETALRLALGSAQPNPARSRMIFSFEIPARGEVAIRLYDAAGRLVRTLVEGSYEPGRYLGGWDGQDETGHPAPAGVYFYELRAGEERLSRSVSWTR